MTKEIPLNKGKVALLDDEDYENIIQWKWFAYEVGGYFYAKSLSEESNGVRKYLFMHRVVLDIPSNRKTRWIDGNTLNNQKGNLTLKGFDTEEERKINVSNRNKNYSTQRKSTVISAYGGVCECCLESKIEFLCIDHINGGGSQQRNSGLKGHSFYIYLIKNNFPEGYRVLCHNCNFSYGKFGYCPHNKENL